MKRLPKKALNFPILSIDFALMVQTARQLPSRSLELSQ